MSSIFGSNNYDFLFGNTSNNSGLSGLFGGGSSMLGDYSMIKSGVYKKLLKSYYAQTSDNDKSTSESKSSSRKQSTTATKNSAETTKLLSAKTNASDLQSAASDLKNRSLYRATGKDEKGNDVYDRDKIKKTVKNFISAYNSYLDSTSNVNSTNVLKKSLSAVKLTASNQKLLKSVGISIGADNKLSLDEDKLSEANMSTLTSLFTGSNSYADGIMQKASETYKLANSATYSGSSGSSYTYGGSYSVMGTKNNSWDQYL